MYNKSKKCKHIAALIYYVNHEESLSKTDKEQEWGKPSAKQLAKEKYSKGKFFFEMRGTPKLFNTTPKKCSDMNSILNELENPSPLKYICTEMNKDKDLRSIQCLLTELIQKIDINLKLEDCRVCLENIFVFVEEYSVFSKNYDLTKNLQKFYEDSISLSKEEIIQLACETLDQADNKDWFAARKKRISASKNAHRIKSRVTKSVESLVSDILFEKKISSKCTQYGIANERNARSDYEHIYKVSVKQVGVIVSEYQPWLCASLDGIVVHDGVIDKIVEIKCPESCKNLPVMNEDTQKINVNYLELKSDVIYLKRSHMYYTQCQLQLYISGQSTCDLFVWSPVSSLCVQVDRDEKFLETVVHKCEEFYFKKYLPEIYNLMQKKFNDSDSSVPIKKRRFTGTDISNTV